MQVGQLHGVGDRLDLGVQPTDVGVGDVGHLLENDLLELGSGQLLVEQQRAGVHEHRVTGAQLDAGEVLGDLGHLLLVSAADDERTATVFQHLENRHDLAAELRIAGEHDVQRFVQDHFLALAELLGIEAGVDRNPHLAPAREHVHRAVVVAAQVGPIGGRRLGELVHLLAQRGDVLLGLLEREGQFLVLGHRVGKLALGLEQPLLQGAYPSWRFLQPAPELSDLVLGLLGPAVQLLSVLVIGREPCASIAFHLRDHLLALRISGPAGPYTGLARV